MSLEPSGQRKNDAEALKVIEKLGWLKCPRCNCYFVTEEDRKLHLTHGICASGQE